MLCCSFSGMLQRCVCAVKEEHLYIVAHPHGVIKGGDILQNVLTGAAGFT